MPVDIAAAVTGAFVIGIIFIGVVGNGLTLFVFFRYTPLRDVTGLFLANLAFADLLQSIFGMPLIATSAFHKEWVFGGTLCVISGMTNSLFCITSVLTLTAVSVDRYLAIVYPLEYLTWLTIRRARLVLVYLWLQALLAAVLPVFGWSRYVYLPYEFICTVQWEYDKAYTIFAWGTCFVAPLFVTVVCYGCVLKVARQQAREKQPTALGEFSDTEQVPDVGETAMDDGKNLKNARENLGFNTDGLDNSEEIESITPEKNITNFSDDKSAPRKPIGPLGKMGRSRVSPLVVDSVLLNGWTNVNPRRNELTVIPEEDEKMDNSTTSSRLTGYLARVRKRMSERKIRDILHRRKEIKVALILLVVNGTFVLCWLPHFIGALCLTFTEGSCPLPDSFFIVTTTLAMLNSGCNPFIYTLTYRKFRQAFKKVLPCLRLNQNRNP